MNKKQTAFVSGALLVFISLFSFLSCKKVGLSTELGDDLIPVVDNVNTFDTVLNVESYNYAFTPANDSLRVVESDEHFLGVIRPGQDPLFGATTAEMYMELKPSLYPFAFARKDSLVIDSVVLVLDYNGTYGDTNDLQKVDVFEVDPATTAFKPDSAYRLNNPLGSIPVTTLLGSRTFAPSVLNDSVKAFRDTTINQLRIKLDNTFGQRLLDYDTATVYKNDSSFRSKFKGFALKPNSGFGKAVMGFSLNSANTKLAIYYKFPKPGTGVDSATVNYFFFNPATCSNANFVERNRTGSESFLSFDDAAQDDKVYLQNAPGTYTMIKIPGLNSVTNRIVHRAELIFEEVYDISDKTFTTPQYLFLDAYDTAKKKYRTVPNDFVLTFSSSGTTSNFQSFGMGSKKTVDGSGNSVEIWRFNISRHVQRVLTKQEPNYDLRLLTHLEVFDLVNLFSDQASSIGVNPSAVAGRVRLTGGNYADAARRMRLRIIYSKI